MKHKQNEIFYLNVSIGNLDELVDLEDEVPDSSNMVEDAIEKAKEYVQNYDLPIYIYKCVPVYKVKRGKTKVIKLRG